MPDGADTVVIQENTSRHGDKVVIAKPATVGRNVRLRGIDFAEGEVLLRQGRRLTDRDVMLAAAMNHPLLPVHRRPRVAVLGTGDELVAPGTTPGQARSSIPTASPCSRWRETEGAEVLDLGIAPDRIDDIAARRARRRANGAPISW